MRIEDREDCTVSGKISGQRKKKTSADGWAHAVSEGVGEKRVPVWDPLVGPRATSPTGPNRSPGPFLVFFFFYFFYFSVFYFFYNFCI
jgi:hypothetical protein